MSIEVIGGIAVFVIIVIVAVCSSGKEDKKAKSGEDKAKIMRIVSEKVEGYGSYTTVFADWDEKKYSGTGSLLKVQTTSWNYAMCFNHTEVKLIPLIFGENTVSGGEVFTLSQENLSLVNGKDGQTWVSFYNKDGEEVVSLFVDPEPRTGMEKPVNLNQREEFEKFQVWLPQFMNTINSANGTTASHKILKK